MLTPTEMLMSAFTSSATSAVVAPTAASAVAPANLPTTITSAALNSSCKTPVAASGSEKRMIFGSSAPSVILTCSIVAAISSLLILGITAQLCLRASRDFLLNYTGKPLFCGTQNLTRPEHGGRKRYYRACAGKLQRFVEKRKQYFCYSEKSNRFHGKTGGGV